MTILSIKKLSSLLSILILTLNVFGQTPGEDLKKYTEKYNHEKMIKLNREIIISVNLDKKETFNITKTVKETDYILYKKASIYNKDYVQYSKLIDLNYLKASTLFPEEKKYKEYKVSEDHYSTKDKQSSSIFFDDNKETSFIYPKLTQGAKRVSEYQLQIKEPRLMSSVYFQSYIPTEYMKIEVITSNTVNLGFKKFNLDTFDIKYTTEEKKGKIYHTWIAKNIPKYENDPGSPNPAFYIPHLVFYIKDYDTKDGKKTMLSDVSDLHKWYYSLVKDINKEKDVELEAIVDSLITPTDTDLEKVQKIYLWVQSNIKYVAFEAGYGGFIPREAGDICEKRFGDCKDMSSIITDMLDIAKVKSDLTWIGTRSIPYTYKEVHTPSVDNHMIASFTDDNDEIYFLDATSSYLPFGMVSEFIQGKQAMINLEDGNYKLATVPITPSEKNLVYDSVKISLKDNKLIGKGHFEINGYTKVKYSYFYPTLSEKEKRDYVKNSLEKGNNKFTVNSTKDYNFEERDKPSLINYEFQIDNYISSSNDELYINLNLDKFMKGAAFEDDRRLPYEIPYKYINKQIILFDIPSGYEVTFTPEDKKYDNGLFGFDIQYEKENNQIKLTSIFSIETLLIEAEKFENWNDFIKKINKKYNEVIILKKK